ncbi:hypothetical protein [Streptomyces sp. NPDC004284]|uniref:hypothetical protein n=1 Tax=Streptomyces sp. NPDC004284 TaxID=3364695 RepID=UPI003692CC97
MNLQEAVDNYETAMQHCDNLIETHRAPAKGQGRRTVETSINRGTIVLAVAAWQAIIQDIAMVLRDELVAEAKNALGTRLLADAIERWKMDFEVALKDFSTPNPDNTRNLLKRVGFDPQSHWTWTQSGGRGNSSITVKPKHVRKVIFQWIRVRNDVAHGHTIITSLPILGAVRDPESSAGLVAAPTLRLDDAIACVKFFRSVARLTVEGAASLLGEPIPTWKNLPSHALGLHVSHLPD